MRSCETCLRGPIPKPVESNYCAQCGDDLAYYVAQTYDDWKAGESRIDSIGQNVNTAEHYAHVMSMPDIGSPLENTIRIYPVKVVAIDEADDVLFTLEAFDEFAATIDVKTVLSNSNIKQVLAAIDAAVASLKLEG